MRRAFLWIARVSLAAVDKKRQAELADPEQRRADELKRIEAPALVLLASVLLLSREGTGTPDAFPKDWREGFDQALTEATTIDAATRSEALEPGLIALVVSQSKRIWRDYRADYNLACFHTRAARYDDSQTDDALKLLSAAVSASSPLAEWAQDDPSLQWLRDHRATDFWPIVGGEPPRSGLGELNAVGPALAGALEKMGIKDAATLREELQSTQDVSNLAGQLGVPRQLVARWQAIAQMCAVEGLTLDDVNMLEEAGVRTRAALARMRAVELQRLLRVVAGQDSTAQVPPEWELEGWIDSAAKKSS